MSAISNSLAPRESIAGTAFRGIGRTLKTWWIAYMNWRIERLAISRLHSMSDRELKDIGLTRDFIEFAVRGGTDRHPMISRYY